MRKSGWYNAASQSTWRNYAKLDSRPALRRANVVEETRIHVDRRHYAQFGHWRDDGDFQRGGCFAAQAAALPGAGAAGGCARSQLARPADVVGRAELRRPARAQPEFQRAGDGGGQLPAGRHRRRGSRAGARDLCVGRFLCCDGRAADCGPRLPARRDEVRRA
ncbi:MAG: hypothetical protein JMDDDDMK_03771 [Acidobacteria bacterium]|nr:hypothetical protein [Acidobacteriota bacterium]